MEENKKKKEENRWQRKPGVAEPPIAPKEKVSNTQTSIGALGRKMEQMAKLFGKVTLSIDIVSRPSKYSF